MTDYSWTISTLQFVPIPTPTIPGLPSIPGLEDSPMGWFPHSQTKGLTTEQARAGLEDYLQMFLGAKRVDSQNLWDGDVDLHLAIPDKDGNSRWRIMVTKENVE